MKLDPRIKSLSVVLTCFDIEKKQNLLSCLDTLDDRGV